ncbi:MAG: hypothetical protein KKB59_19110 [Spirochaetes bacterium]|nr:hypothetical protein [Spirochaetota bacterium]
MDKKMKVIYVDIDGTIAKYKGYILGRIGPPIPDRIELLRKLKKEGYTIVIWSHRHEWESRPWLKKHDVPYDRIQLGKPVFTVLWEDKSVNEKTAAATYREIKRIERGIY